ncbi:hypothetical protein V8B97DRAFT_473633 [Scleroderma yunnanense]
MSDKRSDVPDFVGGQGVDNGANKKGGPSRPRSSAKADRRNKSAPYPPPQQIPLEYAHAQSVYAEHLPPDADPDPCKRDQCQDAFDDIFQTMPKDCASRALRAQYADCEVVRHRVLTLTWELERLVKWKNLHTRSLKFVEEQSNGFTQEQVEFWKSWCESESTRLQDEESTRALLKEEASMLAHLQKHFKSNEELAVRLGVYGPEEVAQPRDAPTENPSDTKESNLETFGADDPDLLHTSDSEILSQSDISIDPE